MGFRTERPIAGTNLSDVEDDLSLVKKAQAGNDDAFAELLRRYEVRIYGLCYRMLGEATDAREITQDTFVAAWRGLDRFRQESAVFTWLFRIAVNLCLLRRRGLGRFRRALGRLAGDARSEQLGASGIAGGRGETAEGSDETSERPSRGVISLSRRGNPEHVAEAVERRQVIERALAVLEPDLRAAVLLRDHEGFAYDELAAALGWKLGTVKSRLNRARARMVAEIQRIAPDLVPKGRR